MQVYALKRENLGYFENDYKAINQNNILQENFFLANSTGSQLQTATKPLYNGNINQMITSIREFMRGDKPNPNPPLAQNYQYDQLNRLITVDNFYDNNLPATNQWASTATATNSFKESYTYDANGNILHLDRYDDAGTIMDNFNYNYPANRNRLNHVKDAVNNSIHTTDVESQLDYNYAYDKIGNVIKNEQEEIENIEWNVGGKVKKINRKPSSTKDDLEFRYDAMGHRIVKIVKPRPLGNSSNEDQWIYTYYIRDANGNIMAVYNTKTTETNNTYKVQYHLEEHTLYGSSRIGVASSPTNTPLSTIEFANAVSFKTDGSYDLANTAITQSSYSGNPNISYHYLGTKQYELTNHLGSVLATVSDIKKPISDNNGTIVSYEADVTSAQHYYTGGSLMTNRTYQSNKLRFGYQGSEKDDEITGTTGSHIHTHYRGGDLRLLQWDAIDPKYHLMPWQSPYSMMNRNPVLHNDPMGDIVEIEGEISSIGPQTEFATKTREMINNVTSQSPEAANMYNELHKSDFVYKITPTKGDNYFSPGDIKENTEPNFNKETQTYEASGGRIFFNPKSQIPTFEQRMNSNLSQESYRSEISLFHELAHADDARQGLLKNYNLKVDGLKVNEWSATHRENIIRGQMNLPLRTYYGASNSNGIFSPSPPMLLKKTSEGLFQSANPDFQGIYYPAPPILIR